MSLELFVLILHVLGASIVMGVVFFSLVLSVKREWTSERLAALRFIGKFGKWASAWQVVTGSWLAYHNWDAVYNNKLFWAKMTVYVIEGTLAGLLIERKVAVAQAGERDNKLSVLLLTHAVLIALIIAISVTIVETAS